MLHKPTFLETAAKRAWESRSEGPCQGFGDEIPNVPRYARLVVVRRHLRFFADTRAHELVDCPVGRILAVAPGLVLIAIVEFKREPFQFALYALEILNFQRRNGLTASGVADEYTQQVLYSAAAKAASGSSSGSSSSSSSSVGYRLLYWGCRGDAVKKLQNALIDAGYKSIVRKADGIFGQWTYDAVRAYQKANGLAVDGIAGKNTQNALYGTSY